MTTTMAKTLKKKKTSRIKNYFSGDWNSRSLFRVTVTKRILGRRLQVWERMRMMGNLPAAAADFGVSHR